MTPESTPQPPKSLRPIPWWVALIGVAAIVVSTVGVYWWLTASAAAAGSTQDARLRVEIIRNSLTVSAGLGGVAALALAFRRQHFVEKQHVFQEHQQARHEWDVQTDREQRERIAEAEKRHREKVADDTERDATERRITDLRLQAVEQLGSDKAPVRIGGLHNLERLGRDHPQLRPLVFSEICAYLRMPFTPPEMLPSRTDTSDARQEQQVRLTAQRVLTRHLIKGDDFWEHETLDLSGATLIAFSVRDARVRGLNLFSAELFEHTDFTNVEFTGLDLHGLESHGPFEFNGCEFTGEGIFAPARLRMMTFSDCVFHGPADFAGQSQEFEFVDTVAAMERAEASHWPTGWHLYEDPKQPGWGRIATVHF